MVGSRTVTAAVGVARWRYFGSFVPFLSREDGGDGETGRS
jgi:hypothetical protein